MTPPMPSPPVLFDADLLARRRERAARMPEDFLRLTLADSPNGPRVYYGNSHEHDRTGAALDALLAR